MTDPVILRPQPAPDYLVELSDETAARHRFPPPIWARAAEVEIDSDPLIRGLIPRNALVVTFGASGSTKTVHVLDRDICTAAGRPYYGRETAGGIVLYIPTEGRTSARNRVVAYCRERLDEDTDVPLAILPASVDLLNPATPPLLIDYIKQLSDDQGLPAVKVTVDTLSRAMAGGDENSAIDMTTLIQHADAIRTATGATVELVHHAGKDTAKGARGHSALRAAVDTEIEVKNTDGYCVARVTKQRDLDTGDEYAYRLEVIELGLDRWGHPITTVLPVWIEDHQAAPPERRLPPQAQRLLWLVREGIEHVGEFPSSDVMRRADPPPPAGAKGITADALRAYVEERGGISDSEDEKNRAKAIRRHLMTLDKERFIFQFSNFLWLSNKG